MKKFISLVTFTAATLIGLPTLASGNDHVAHTKLVENLEKVGITMIVNNPVHCPEKRRGGGSYSPYSALLSVCQDNGNGDGVMVNWTLNDYDTLRHEAHHVIQDCVNGDVGDGKMAMLFDAEEWVQFTKGIDDFVYAVYSEQKKIGASDTVAMEEVEAYVVAEYIPAANIAKKVLDICLR